MSKMTRDFAGYYAPEKIGKTRHVTPEGFLVLEGTPIARTGEQIYAAHEVNKGVASDDPLYVTPNGAGFIVVERLPEEVFRTETLQSFEGKDFVIEHPPEGVDVTNWKNQTVGHVQNVRRGTGIEDDLIIADIIVKDPIAIDYVNKNLPDLSAGYKAEYDPAEPGRAIQRNIIGNHVAGVKAGRAGARVSVRDHKGGDMSTLDNDPDQPRDPVGKWTNSGGANHEIHNYSKGASNVARKAPGKEGAEASHRAEESSRRATSGERNVPSHKEAAQAHNEAAETHTKLAKQHRNQFTFGHDPDHLVAATLHSSAAAWHGGQKDSKRIKDHLITTGAKNMAKRSFMPALRAALAVVGVKTEDANRVVADLATTMDADPDPDDKEGKGDKGDKYEKDMKAIHDWMAARDSEREEEKRKEKEATDKATRDAEEETKKAAHAVAEVAKHEAVGDTVLEAEGPGMAINLGKTWTGSMTGDSAEPVLAAVNSRVEILVPGSSKLTTDSVKGNKGVVLAEFMRGAIAQHAKTPVGKQNVQAFLVGDSIESLKGARLVGVFNGVSQLARMRNNQVSSMVHRPTADGKAAVRTNADINEANRKFWASNSGGIK